MGVEEEQSQDELRDNVKAPEILLRQEHHTQDCREEVIKTCHVFILLKIFQVLSFSITFTSLCATSSHTKEEMNIMVDLHSSVKKDFENTFIEV